MQSHIVENPINGTIAPPADAIADSSATISTSSRSPALPPELAEDVLLHVGLRFPLHKFEEYDRAQCQQVHNHCAAAMAVMSPSHTMIRVLVPRLLNGAELIIANPSVFGADYLQRLYQRGYDAFWASDAFTAAMRHNRVDILEWWIKDAELLELPEEGSVSIKAAIEGQAWDALDWLVKAGLGESYCFALAPEELAQLIDTQEERMVQFVTMWVNEQCEVSGTLQELLELVCKLGCVQLLEQYAPAGGAGIHVPDVDHDVLSLVAIRGRGPVVPLLDWMLAREWDLPNVAEYASAAGKLDVLEWWKVNKEQIDAQLAARHDRPSETGYCLPPIAGEPPAGKTWAELNEAERGVVLEAKMEVEELEIEPEWLLELKHGFCLDLARESGHQHVIDWWMQNLDLLPMPNSVQLVDCASGQGDLELLKIWGQRWKSLATHRREAVYYGDRALCKASQSGQLEVLQWWLHESGIPVSFAEDHVVRNALASHRWKETLDWWINKSGRAVSIGSISAMLVNSASTDAKMLDRLGQFRREFGG